MDPMYDFNADGAVNWLDVSYLLKFAGAIAAAYPHLSKEVTKEANALLEKLYGGA